MSDEELHEQPDGEVSTSSPTVSLTYGSYNPINYAASATTSNYVDMRYPFGGTTLGWPGGNYTYGNTTNTLPLTVNTNGTLIYLCKLSDEGIEQVRAIVREEIDRSVSTPSCAYCDCEEVMRDVV